MQLIIILLCALAALIELDNTSIGQFGFGRAFITGTIFGVATGDCWSGMQLGMFIELLFLDYTPVGGVLPPNGTMAAFCAVMAKFFGWPACFAFAFGIMAGIIFKYIEIFLRGLSGRLLMMNMTELPNHPIKIMNRFIFNTLCLQLAVNFIFTLVVVFIVKQIIFHTPEINYKLQVAFNFAYLSVPWMGVMLLLKKFTFKVR
ncbi:PTS system mannose-specific IIC component [Elusimicrobium posterum]|uniref:PTS sugar transporter subunit IIC n=1 Tax=Elusimicrobium posterum TaxID=3116653 RepID=UPI003C755067